MGPVVEMHRRNEDRLDMYHAADEEVPVVAHAVGRERSDRLVEAAREDEVAARHRNVVLEQREAGGRAGASLCQHIPVPDADGIIIAEPGPIAVQEIDPREGDEIPRAGQRIEDDPELVRRVSIVGVQDAEHVPARPRQAERDRRMRAAIAVEHFASDPDRSGVAVDGSAEDRPRVVG